MPDRNSPNLKEFAQRLLEHEIATSGRAGSPLPATVGAHGVTRPANEVATFRICEKLRVSLGKLMGVAGYRSLSSRAVALAGADVPWLRGLHIRADGTLEGLAELKSKLNREQIAEGEIVLVAELLRLMVTFIGPTLTLQLIQQAWPKADFTGWKL